jgi:seryl-tRNA synthetase
MEPGTGVSAKLTPADGVYLYPESFEQVVDGIRAAVGGMASVPHGRRLSAPPVIARAVLERAGYVETFPHLVGSVQSLATDTGDPPTPADVVLAPASCYHAFALVADTDLPEPIEHLVHGTCFRMEATSEPGRLRSFRMTEVVRVAGPEVVQWRDAWLGDVSTWLTDLGLDVEVAVATDPFFGPGQRLLRATQREQELKFECLVPVAEGVRQAVASANYHKDHLTNAFAITVGAATAYSACVAFGLERIVLALAHAHGPDPARWPAGIGHSRAGIGH